MRIYNRYVLALGIAFSLSTILMALGGVREIAIYFTVHVIIYLTTTTLFVYFNPHAKRALGAVAFVFFVGFMSLVILKVLEIFRG